MKIQASPSPMIDLNQASDTPLLMPRRRQSTAVAEPVSPEPSTEQVARDALRRYAPDAADGILTLLPPGCAGAVPFVVETRRGKLCMKVRRDPADIVETSPRRRRRADLDDLVGEAKRAQWAGERTHGPAVRFIDDRVGAYACDFVAGRSVSPATAGGKYLPAFMAAMCRLHATSPEALPPPGPRNWLCDQKLESCLASAEFRQPRSYVSSVLQLERGIETLLARAVYRPAPIHDDLHPGNSILTKTRLVLIDWAGLKLHDPMIDLGHFAFWTDLPIRQTSTMVKLYDAASTADGVTAGPEALQRLQLRLTWFRVKTMVFFEQWPGTRERARQYRSLLFEDVAAIRQSLADNLGLRFSADALTSTG
jgi:hypothetical protein